VANEETLPHIRSSLVASEYMPSQSECRIVANEETSSQRNAESRQTSKQGEKAVRPNKPLKLTPLCGHEIGSILKSRSGSNAFPIYWGGAA
jgi:hypothetical protein